MNTQTIKAGLTEYDQSKVDIYVNYLIKLESEKNKDKSLKNPWMKHKSDEQLINYFKQVAQDGLYFDGEHITLQATGVSYDYVAYKNKMYLVYPESLIDVDLVYKDDSFKFQKQSGKVIYAHDMNNPFDQKQENIVGGYCIIKNKRGEFITLLNAANIEKHRKVAKTDTIWRSWFHEMCYKTLIKKACKRHFADIYQNVDALDNENYDLEQPLGVSVDDKVAVEKTETLDDLEKFYHENKGRNAGVLKDFNKLVSNRKAEIEKNQTEEAKRTSEDEQNEREPGQEG